jgi:hypothetical protein
VASNRRTNEEILQTLTRYVLPRHLSSEQIAKISGYLEKYEPQTFGFLVAKYDTEAGGYRVDIQRALTNGGWLLKETKFTESVPAGLSIQFQTTLEYLNRPADIRHPRTDILFADAFRLAKISVDTGAP